MCMKVTPACFRIVASTQVCAGTSVIFASRGSGIPNCRESCDEKTIPRTRSSRSSDSVCRLAGRACHTSRPSRIASATRRRRSGVCPGQSTCSIGQPESVQTKRCSGGIALAPSHTVKALSIIEVRYFATTFRARSVYPMSKWVLKTTTTSSTAAWAGMPCPIRVAPPRLRKLANRLSGATWLNLSWLMLHA